MKIIKSKQKIEMAARLYQLIVARRAIEKEEEELKSFFKVDLKSDLFLKLGRIIITGQWIPKRGLDKDKLLAHFGAEKLKEFESSSEYLKMEVLEDRSADATVN